MTRLPCQQNPGNRCARSRSPRSPPTVGADGKRSLDVQLNALFHTFRRSLTLTSHRLAASMQRHVGGDTSVPSSSNAAGGSRNPRTAVVARSCFRIWALVPVAATRDRRRVVGGRRSTAGRRASNCRRDRTWGPAAGGGPRQRRWWSRSPPAAHGGRRWRANRPMAWSQADKRFEEPEAENAPAEATGPSSDADNFSASGKSPAAD